MQKTTLVILAAGLGSRFRKGIKQLTPVGPGGELIIEYSIYDALEAGFDRVVFIIRRDLERDFKDTIGRRVETLCPVEYVFQELDSLPEGFTVPEGRIKPWGTGQALLMCRGVVNEPFVVINSDDYYGKDVFVKIHDYLLEHLSERDCCCMAGYTLKNTLSENGGVTRGVCKVDDNGFLTDIVETTNIVKCSGGVRSEITGEKINPDSDVSMNIWGFAPEFLEVLHRGFPRFLGELGSGNLTSEYLLPAIIGQMLRAGTIRVAVLETDDSWFGVTYAEDRENVQDAFRKLVDDGVYSSPLF